VRTRGALAGRLVERGWPAHTPCAIVFGASQPDSFTVTRTLATLGDEVFDTELPGVVVIGEVVSLARPAAVSAASALGVTP